jgi:hypothetical protein
MAETKISVKTEEPEKIKTVKVEIIKFHPLVAHEVGEQAEIRPESAEEWIKKGYAKAVK